MVLAGLALVIVVFLPPGPHLICHRMLDGALQQWMLENHTNTYPNINGSRLESLSVLERYSLPLAEFRDYVYVPGLCRDDPHDLVMWYVREKSRRRWHGDTPTIFRERKWVIISPQGTSFETPDGEDLNYWVDTQEIRARLQKTIEFLERNSRPGWQNVARENAEFLKGLQD